MATTLRIRNQYFSVKEIVVLLLLHVLVFVLLEVFDITLSFPARIFVYATLTVTVFATSNWKKANADMQFDVIKYKGPSFLLFFGLVVFFDYLHAKLDSAEKRTKVTVLLNPDSTFSSRPLPSDLSVLLSTPTRTERQVVDANRQATFHDVVVGDTVQFSLETSERLAIYSSDSKQEVTSNAFLYLRCGVQLRDFFFLYVQDGRKPLSSVVATFDGKRDTSDVLGLIKLPIRSIGKSELNISLHKPGYESVSFIIDVSELDEAHKIMKRIE